MKQFQGKPTKLVLNTPTQKQSPTKCSGSQNYLKNLKQSSRYNSKLVTMKPEQTLNSPVHLLQKNTFSTQTPSRSSGKMVYVKNKNTNPLKTDCHQTDPYGTRSQLEKFAFEKSLEIDVYAPPSNFINARGSSSTSNHTSQRLSSLTPRELSLELQQQKILENFAKKSPTSSSHTQAKLLVMLQKDPNSTKKCFSGKDSTI